MTKDLARGFDIFTRRKPFHLARMQVSTILRFVSERKLIRWPKYGLDNPGQRGRFAIATPDIAISRSWPRLGTPSNNAGLHYLNARQHHEAGMAFLKADRALLLHAAA